MPPGVSTANGRKELVAANTFGIRIPGIEIGYFRECHGLSIEFDVLEYAEGGNNEFVHHLPGRLRYPNLELDARHDHRGQPPQVVLADAPRRRTARK